MVSRIRAVLRVRLYYHMILGAVVDVNSDDISFSASA